MKKVIESFYCNLYDDSGTYNVKYFSLVEDVNTNKMHIIAHETYVGIDEISYVSYSFAHFESLFKINLADLFTKAGISLNEKKNKIYKTKGLSYYATDCSSKKEAVATFIMEKIGVTEGDIEEYYGEIPEDAVGIYSFDGIKIFNK